MRRYVIFIIVCLLTTVGAQAQNSIDKLVEKYSITGGSVFITVVKRNPRTRKVEKVVKTLEVEYGHGAQFYRAFKAESATGTWSEMLKDNMRTTLLVIDKSDQVRIYMLKKKEKKYPDKSKVTIIIQTK
ncbi:UNVERIFIED_CONTAM: DUF5024 domain-containing protein [Prevotella sp. 15_C9]